MVSRVRYSARQSTQKKPSSVAFLYRVTHFLEQLDLVVPPVLSLGLEEIGEDGLGVGPDVSHQVVVGARLLVRRHQARVRPLDEGVGCLSSVHRFVVLEVDDDCRVLFVARRFWSILE